MVVVGAMAKWTHSVWTLALLLSTAAFADPDPGRSADLRRSCDSLTWDVAIDMGLQVPRVPGRVLQQELDREMILPRLKSPSEAAIAGAVGWNPWVWAKIPHLSTRVPAIYLSFAQWFAGMRPMFAPSQFEAYPAVAALAENPLLSSYAQLDQALDAFFLDERLYEEMRREGSPFFAGVRGQTREQVAAALQDRRGGDHKEVGFDALTRRTMNLVCAIFAPTRFSGCGASALRQGGELSGGMTLLLGGPHLARILTTTDERVPLAAYRLARSLRPGLRWKRIGNVSLFDDVKAAFRQVGFTEAEAEDWAWDFVLLVVAHGQNTGVALRIAGVVQPFNFWTIFAADHVSALAAYSDSLRALEGKPFYSWPSTVKSSCENGKPYHFWVAAYSARAARRAGDSEFDAAWGAYVLEIGYQMTSRTYARDPERDLREGAWSVWNARNRLDLAYASAGALYGARSESARRDRSYSIDRSYALQYRMAGRTLRLPESWWKRTSDESDAEKRRAIFAQQWIAMMAPGWAMRAYE
jgi:hypothetical protein